MAWDVDRLEQQIRAAEQPEKYDLEALGSVMTSEWFQKCLRPIMDELDGARKQLEKADLTSEQGNAKALKLQGKIQGLTRLMDSLVEQVNSLEDHNGE